MIPEVVHRVGHVPATTFAARLPTTAGGNTKAVNALPAMVLPPMAVRLSTLSAATPAGAVASINAGSVFDPVAVARNARAPGVWFAQGEAVYAASAETIGEAGSADVPPVGDPYMSNTVLLVFTTRTATFAAGSV